MSDEIEVQGLRCYITDERYPVLVIEGDCWIKGWRINKESGDLEPMCICAARYEGECGCNYNWK